MSGRPRALLVSLALTGLLVGLAPADAEEWGAIEPGVTTTDQVRARYGAPSKETRGKADGYDILQWVYEGAQAPGGIQRMTVDYGLLTPQGFKPAVVRVLRLEPKAKVFGRNTVIQAWGVPDGITKHNELDTFFYKTGLLVNFDKEGDEAALLTFTPPQPDTPPAAPKR
jgi:hypothetical protein